MAIKTGVHPAALPGSARPPSRRWLALAVLCVSLLIVVLDNTVLNVVLPTLVPDLHASTSQLQWIVDAYGWSSALVIGAGEGTSPPPCRL
jgi:MFS family permease